MCTACGIFNLGFGVLLLFYGFWVRAVPLAEAALSHSCTSAVYGAGL
jgi:hypothetical protein